MYILPCMSRLTVTDHESVAQTLAAMHTIVEGYRDDMLPWASLGPLEIFEIVKKIPYRPDPEPVEFIQRPYYTMSGTGPGGDCDDKAVCIAAWARLNGHPYRFVVVGGPADPEPSHVFAEVELGGRFIPMDVTYSFGAPGVLPRLRIFEVSHGKARRPSW